MLAKQTILTTIVSHENVHIHRRFQSYRDRDSSSVIDQSHFTYNGIGPDFVLEQVPDPQTPEQGLLWQDVLACIEVRRGPTHGPGNVGTTASESPRAASVTVQAGDYARLQLSLRPFQLYSICVIIHGNRFTVSVYDRGGVMHSKPKRLYDSKLRVRARFIKVIRRLAVDMTEAQLGRDPSVELLDPSASVRDDRLTSRPDYNVVLPGVEESQQKWKTTGALRWTSYSLVGRGTTVWTVRSVARKNSILKSAWRDTHLRTESSIYEYLREIGILRQRGITNFVCGSDATFTTSDGETVVLSVNSQRPACAFLPPDDDIVLHRMIFRPIGKPFWEFSDPSEFVRGLMAIVDGTLSKTFM